MQSEPELLAMIRRLQFMCVGGKPGLRATTLRARATACSRMYYRRGEPILNYNY